MAVPNRNDLPTIDKTEQGILNRSFDEDYQTLVFQALGFNGVGLQRFIADSLAMKITESGSYTYFAFAAPGTAQATNKWQAFRIDESVSGTMAITWADGNANFDNVATDLTSLSYS